MSYPVADQLVWPIKPYKVLGYKFGCSLRRHFFLWATQFGDDVGKARDVVSAIGDGEVVWSGMHPGNKRVHHWGGLVIVGHGGKGQNFYSVYGHLRDLKVKVGDQVVMGQQLGVVAEGQTPENGWWKIPHLHFAIYTGPWRDQILPGFHRCWERRTKREWWRDPKGFIKAYNRV